MKKVAITNRFDNKFDTYRIAVEAAGGSAKELPKRVRKEDAETLLKKFDALILTGGGDVDPKHYGEENTFSKGIIPLRDETEITLVKAAFKLDLPVLGICRGMQVANVAFGGTLYQDLEENGFSNHSESDRKYELVHSLRSCGDGVLPDILGARFDVNSVHHQAVKNFGNGFKATLVSPDGVIEGMERNDRKFFAFVQFHPEILIDKDEKFLEIFKALLK